MQEANTLDRRNIRRQIRLLHVFVMILPAMSMVGHSYNCYYVTLSDIRKASPELCINRIGNLIAAFIAFGITK
jgi:hypothetical protein